MHEVPAWESTVPLEYSETLKMKHAHGDPQHQCSDLSNLCASSWHIPCSTPDCKNWHPDGTPDGTPLTMRRFHPDQSRCFLSVRIFVTFQLCMFPLCMFGICIILFYLGSIQEHPGSIQGPPRLNLEAAGATRNHFGGVLCWSDSLKKPESMENHGGERWWGGGVGYWSPRILDMSSGADTCGGFTVRASYKL